MFDIGFWELIIIAIVALLVVGPDRFPDFARQAGKWLAKFRRLINNLQREIKQELSIDEGKVFKQQLEELDGLMKNAPDQDPDFSDSLTHVDKKNTKQ
ncbi:MAG: twin-arginine translocase subunit TatB [Proteobacteria bacterium]|nr:twin-arginine translocase subunit TatB [Pseudomonadota bacterium]